MRPLNIECPVTLLLLIKAVPPLVESQSLQVSSWLIHGCPRNLEIFYTSNMLWTSFGKLSLLLLAPQILGRIVTASWLCMWALAPNKKEQYCVAKLEARQSRFLYMVYKIINIPAWLDDVCLGVFWVQSCSGTGLLCHLAHSLTPSPGP